MRVGELERRLLDMLPESAAEPWDRTGMLVGDAAAEVTGVAIALDPTIQAIDFAVAHGANVLLTHHPLYLDFPERVASDPARDAVGARMWHALKSDVSIISFHTALDANPRAARVLADPLGLEPGPDILETVAGHPGFGYGRICEAAASSASAYRQLCEKVFGRKCRLWGNPAQPVKRICLWTGAAGDAPQNCVSQGVDLLICGEVKYHAALDAVEAGLAIIDLGHDVSEQPHCYVLLELAKEAGIPAAQTFLMDLPATWE